MTPLPRRFLFVAVLQLSLLGMLIGYMNLAITTIDGRTLFKGSDTSLSSSNENNELMAKVDLVHPKPKNYDPPKIVWLLSFPNRYVVLVFVDPVQYQGNNLIFCVVSRFPPSYQWYFIHTKTNQSPKPYVCCNELRTRKQKGHETFVSSLRGSNN